MKNLLFGFPLLICLVSCTQKEPSYSIVSQQCDICVVNDSSDNTKVTQFGSSAIKSLQNNSQEPITNNIKLSPLAEIVNSALEYNRTSSSLPAVIEQRKMESEVVKKNNWPMIQPIARYSNHIRPYIGVSADYTIFDFGSSSHKEKQSELNITTSELDFLVEERTVIATTLESLAKIASLVENKKLLQKSINDIRRLVKYADIRLNAGIASLSESNTLALRLSELQSDLDAVNIEIRLNLDLLSAKLSHPISVEQVPSLSQMQSELLPDFGDAPLQLRQAENNKAIAYSQLEQTKSDSYPHLAVEGELGKSTNGDNINNIGLVIKAPTSIFSSSATIKAAEAAYLSSNKVFTKLKTDIDTENKRIQLELDRLSNNRKTLESLEMSSVAAVQIFNEEFEVNNSSLSDGLSAYRTLLQTRQQLVSLKAQLLQLKASKIRITSGKIFKD